MAAKRCRKGGCSSQRSSEQIWGAKALQPRSSQHSLQDRPLGSSDDSTQPPDGWLEHGDNPDNERCEAMSRATMRRRGKAKGTEFANLRKLGRVPVNVPYGARGPSSTNALVLAARVTYIVRTFADMKHKWWTLVPKEDKEELYTRVLGDFELNWDRYEDRECIKVKLACSYKTYRYELHNIFKRFPTKEAALGNPLEEMRAETWKIMCDQWEEGYKNICQRNAINRRKLKVPHTTGSKSLQNLRAEQSDKDENLIAFYKRSLLRKSDGKFINEVAEQTYSEMMSLFVERDPLNSNLEVAEEVFHEVLGFKSGHVRGLGLSAIPKPSPTTRSSHVTHLAEQVEQYKSELGLCKEKYDELWGHMKVMMAHIGSYDDKLDKILGSHTATQGHESPGQGLEA